MTDIKNILAKYGLTVAADKLSEFEKEFRENYKSVAEVSKIEATRDNYKSQLETAQNTLKGFEGVNVEELKGKVTSLTRDLAAKDEEFNVNVAFLRLRSPSSAPKYNRHL